MLIGLFAMVRDQPSLRGRRQIPKMKKSTSPAGRPRKSASPSKSPAAGAPAKSRAGTKRTGTAARSQGEHETSTGDWRSIMLAEVRRLIHEADPEIVEERKWKKPTNPAGVPVWSHAGIVCTVETYKEVVKLTFARGASLKDPGRLFNASLEGNARRAIDIREGESLDPKKFKALVQAAVAENLRSSPQKAKASQKSGKAADKSSLRDAKTTVQEGEKVVLLSGGNPQIAKAEGDAPVQAYIAAMPDWKSELGRRLDQLIVRAVPQVRKAVKWNSPFYGVEGQGWFLSFHVFTRYVKVTFFAGTSLQPVPNGGTAKSKEVRWIDIYEDDGLDEAQMTSWIEQAAALPGWKT